MRRVVPWIAVRGQRARQRRALSAAVMMMSVVGFAAMATSAADVGEGRRIAERWCESCHVVGMEQGRGSDAAPPFPTIARTLLPDPDRLRGWLADPHPPMPDLSLTQTEIGDLVAYLRSLAR